MTVVRLASRRSPLALRQSATVVDALSARGVDATVIEVVTTGDRDHDASLQEIGGQGAFTLEVQRAVLDGAADVAVHSAKDLPSVTPDGLTLVGVPERLDAADVLVGRALAGLGPGATVATGSPRRRALLLERRPDLTVVGLRGNMARRLASAGRDGVDAVVAAAAALERLGESALMAERLDPSWFVPQVGQGALALECRTGDAELRELLAALCDRDATLAVTAERAFQRALGVGCTVPAGAYASVSGATITLNGVMLAADGSRSVRASLQGTDAHALGESMAHLLRDERGGGALPGWT